MNAIQGENLGGMENKKGMKTAKRVSSNCFNYKTRGK